MPDRELQRAEALHHANDARLDNARLRRRIRQAGPRGGAREAARIVLAGESGITFWKLLRAIPQVGDRTALRMLSQARLATATEKRIRDIGPDRRRLLAGELVRLAERPHRRA